MPKSIIAMLIGQLLAVGVFALPSAPHGASDSGSIEERNWFVGVDECKDCHKKNYITWSKSGHRTTFKKLKLPARKNAKCLKCHSTGHGHETGFKSWEATPQHAMVGCEGCHGPGGLHVKLMKENPDPAMVKDFKIPAPNKESCVFCHKFHRHF